MDDILAEDMGNIFLFDFGQNVLVQSDGPERGMRAIIQPGVYRDIDGRYIKATNEITVSVATPLRESELVIALNDDGVPVGHYRVGKILERDSASIIYELKRERIE